MERPKPTLITYYCTLGFFYLFFVWCFIPNQSYISFKAPQILGDVSPRLARQYFIHHEDYIRYLTVLYKAGADKAW